MSAPKFRAVLVDLSGVVFSGDEAISGSVESISKLRSNGIDVRFVTNTTSTPLRRLVDKLNGLDIEVSARDIFTPATAARRLVAERRLSPHLLVHPALLEDLDITPRGSVDAVIVGDAGDGFSFAALNTAFRFLDEGAELIALARNRTFKGDDGRPTLDAGPFVAALEYASRREALVVGKPSAAFYGSALADLGAATGETAMIGDDVESDVAGAMDAGIAGLLVRTGKYRDGDEDRIDPRPTATFDDLRAAVEWMLDGE